MREMYRNKGISRFRIRLSNIKVYSLETNDGQATPVPETDEYNFNYLNV